MRISNDDIPLHKIDKLRARIVEMLKEEMTAIWVDILEDQNALPDRPAAARDPGARILNASATEEISSNHPLKPARSPDRSRSAGETPSLRLPLPRLRLP